MRERERKGGMGWLTRLLFYKREEESVLSFREKREGEREREREEERLSFWVK